MAKSESGVFQLSLAELAFILVFVLLLLLGWMIFKLEEDAKQLETKIAEAGDIDVSLIMLGEAKEKLTETLLRSGSVKPEEIISHLISQKEIVREREVLRKRIDDLDAQVTMLAEVREIIAQASKQHKKQIADQHIESALTFQSAFKQQLDSTSSNSNKEVGFPKASIESANVARDAAVGFALKNALEKELRGPIKRGTEAELVKELAEAAKQLRGPREARDSPLTIKKENADLRGQVAFLKGRLEARGGRDYPPCWAEENTGRVEFLFEIQIYPDGLLISPAWPPNREPDARELPNIDQLLAQSRQPLKEFNQRMQGIDKLSKEKSCRHYVQMRNHVNELDVFNQYRFGIENFFYKLELR
jgi:hypothetical protein